MEHEGNKNKTRMTGRNYYFIGRPEHIVLSLVTGDQKRRMMSVGRDVLVRWIESDWAEPGD